MRKTDTWMPIDIGAYLGDTMHLRAAEHGAYFLLLMHYWRNGPLPDDDSKLSGIARMTREEWGEIAPTIREFFTLEDGRLHQKRADDERAKAMQISSKRADAAHARHMQNGSNCSANAEQKQTHARVLIPSPSQEEKKDSDAIASAPADLLAPLPDQTGPLPIRTALFRDGIPIVRTLVGSSDTQARALLGGLLKATHDDCARVYALLREAESLRPVDPKGWLFGAAKARASPERESRTAWAREPVTPIIDAEAA